ncbi:hypothetical protein L1987_01280 [Smallanthus sonchifolius]|uniref:Uncharacterized protein n=1 Tax=Smallanthus sonchifolius TaxID=185202 RepID=A0ACB9K4M1_9ASTR|nr:hypothetical protein L1987_01280 [Smallanthus sonchifolius]
MVMVECKTFLWKTLSSAIRCKGEIVLNVASSGIASLLLSGGRTAHSRFHIPLNLNEDSLCHIKSNSDVANLLKETKLIIWDEAPMVHKHAFEALDRTMKDIFNSDTSMDSEMSFGGSQTSNMEQTNNFAKWLLDLGEGNIGGTNDGEATIDIPEDLLINDSPDPISSLIEFVYPSILQHFKDPDFFRERAILAPKNEVVYEINDRLLSLFPGDEKEYLGSEVISLGNRVIEAEIISGGNIGTRTFISRINLIPSDKKIHFKFQRRQFPLFVCFAMTINKSQGQSLSGVGLYLKEPVFTHGQLYVALSRVKTSDGVKLLIVDKDGKVTNQTKNVVYKEIFKNL